MAPRKGTKRKANAEAEKPESSSQVQDLPVRAKDDSPLPSIAPGPSVQGTLKVFDDDDDDDVAVTTTLSAVEKPAVIADSEEEESESDDDEAPEAEATTHVISKAEKSAQSAQQAAQEQAAEQKRKRQQRDTLFKQQATERKATKALQKDTATTEQAPEPSGRRRADRIHIPNVLPDEFLDSSSEGEDDDDEVDSVADSRPKRRKVSAVEQKMARLDRAPRDERIGSTVYRVEKKTDERLAPKAKKYSQGRKGGLLQRGRAPVPSKKGFFKK